MSVTYATRADGIEAAVEIFRGMPSDWKVAAALRGESPEDVVLGVSRRIGRMLRDGGEGPLREAAAQVWKREFAEYVSASLGLL